MTSEMFYNMHYIYLSLFFCVYKILSQNIFDETPICRFTSGNFTYTLNGKQTTIKKFGHHIIFSPCQPVKSTGCDPNALVCILKPIKVSNAGKAFEFFEDKKFPGQKILKSQNGMSCMSDRNKDFTTYIHIESGSSIAPRLMDEVADCELHINVLDSNSQIPCTSWFNGHLIDLRQLQGEMQISTNIGNIALNLCGVASTCNKLSASACVIQNNTTRIIGMYDSHIVNYHAMTKQLEISYKIGSRRDRRNVKVLIKCNWRVLKGNLKYFTVPVQGRNYKFSVESYLGCVKMPMDCYVKSNDNYQYNLTRLYKPDNSWKVLGVSEDVLVLNMCGPLRTSSQLCSANYSQICHKNKNYGSILSQLKLQDDIVTGTFRDGSICPKNTSLTLSTNLNFKCSFQEKGPVLNGIGDCDYNILWETPNACPYYHVSSNELDIVDISGHRNLAGICSSGDRDYRIDSRSYLRYNFCKGLTKKCGSHLSNVSVCLHVAKKEFVLGWTNVHLNSFNGNLFMNLIGENCQQSQVKRSLTVNFECNYAVNVNGRVDTVNVIRDFCIYNMTISSPAACASTTSKTNCVTSNGTHRYNLTKLTRLDKNYVVNVGKLDYFINVCRPVITNREALCPYGTGVCLKNASEPNFKHRFYSLGASQDLSIENGELVLRYKYGRFCGEMAEDISSIIHFKCSNSTDQPVLLKKSKCVFEFMWNTKHACPQKIKVPRAAAHRCVWNNSDYELNLTGTKGRKFVTNSGFTFDICTSIYTRNDSNGDMSAKVTLIKNTNDIYLEYKLNETCINVSDVNKIQFFFVCGNNEEFIIRDQNNCTIKVEYDTNEVCNDDKAKFHEDTLVPSLKPNDDEYLIYHVNENVGSEILSDHDKSTTNANKAGIQNILLEKFVNCSIKAPGFEINLNNIPLANVSSYMNKSEYTIGVNPTAVYCAGYVCSDKQQIVSLENCPEVELENSIIKAIFPFNSKINHSYAVEILFSCREQNELPSLLKETEHMLQFSYPLKEICSLDVQKSNVILVTCVTLILIILAVAFAVILYKRDSLCRKYEAISGNKSSVYVYCKDTDS